MPVAQPLPRPASPAILPAMRARPIVAGLGVVAGVAAVLYLVRGDDAPARTPGAVPPTAGARATSAELASADLPGGSRLVLRRPRTPADAPAAGAVTVGGVTIQGAGIYDPDSADVKANLLEFRKSRLRFALYDAAAECWSGGDDVADVQVAYTLIVEREVLRLEDVRLVDSTLPDPALERCILGRVTELRAPAAEIPDLREDGSSWISLHDLYTRNRRGH